MVKSIVNDMQQREWIELNRIFDKLRSGIVGKW